MQYFINRHNIWHTKHVYRFKENQKSPWFSKVLQYLYNFTHNISIAFSIQQASMNVYGSTEDHLWWNVKPFFNRIFFTLSIFLWCIKNELVEKNLVIYQNEHVVLLKSYSPWQSAIDKTINFLYFSSRFIAYNLI